MQKRDVMGGGGLCPSRELASSSVIQSSYLSCFYVQGTNLSFVFRKHLVPGEFLNLVCVCAPLCAEGASVGCALHVCVYTTWVCMCMHLHLCVCVCLYPCTCVHSHVCMCAHIFTLSHEEGGLLNCTRARG